ncbi:MAG: DUF3574 domain-containing protein [Caulobacter sp.]|nr:DUF3574 domain-containing protein [Caulobacter sp.]
MRVAALAVALVLPLAGCMSLNVVADVDGCPGGLKPVTTAELVFGRNIGAGAGVSDADWRAFVDAEVTPRFPDGLTVADAAGQWRGVNGAIVAEPSKVLLLVLKGEPDERTRIDAIRAAYKARFSQESVLLIERPACVGF